MNIVHHSKMMRFVVDCPVAELVPYFAAASAPILGIPFSSGAAVHSHQNAGHKTLMIFCLQKQMIMVGHKYPAIRLISASRALSRTSFSNSSIRSDVFRMGWCM